VIFPTHDGQIARGSWSFRDNEGQASDLQVCSGPPIKKTREIVSYRSVIWRGMRTGQSAHPRQRELPGGTQVRREEMSNAACEQLNTQCESAVEGTNGGKPHALLVL
jgi:hypothetical protein